MNELTKSLTNTITRDFAYLVGGGTIIASCWIAFDLDKCTDRIPNIAYALLTGVAYVLGFITQEVLSLCPLFSTALYIRSCRTLNRLYHWHTREKWPYTNEERIDIVNAYEILGKLKDESDAMRSLIERTATLKHICTSVGPCFFLSGIVLLLDQFSFRTPHLVAGLVLAILGGFLVIHGRLKTMQQMWYLHRAYITLRSP
jgi:hypothetical protein